MNVQQSYSANGAQTVEQRLQIIKDRIDQGRQEKARAEATLEQLDKQRQELLDELNQLGVSEADLPTEIYRLDKEIEAALREAEAALGTSSTPEPALPAPELPDPQPSGWVQGDAF